MIPPTSIDGTDITGATIDGTDVQEITVDGDVVFSAGPSNLPVAYSNLVAWYPFDSAEYGGSNADDVTAIIGGSGDDTAFDGTVEGASYQSSGGVTDINAGANSGAFNFSGNQGIATTGVPIPQSDVTFSYGGWLFPTSTAIIQATAIDLGDNKLRPRTFIQYRGNDEEFSCFADSTGTNNNDIRVTAPVNNWIHIMFVLDSGTMAVYGDGSLVSSEPGPTTGVTDNLPLHIGRSQDSDHHFDGLIDDVRIYDKVLSSSEVNQIFQNTPHP